MSNQTINNGIYINPLKFQQSEPDVYVSSFYFYFYLEYSYLSEYKQDQIIYFLFKDLTSYNVLPLHNFPRDEDWSEKAQALFFIKPNMRHKEKLQFFSLLKIQ